MPDTQFEFLKNELQAMKLDMKSIQEQVATIHNNLKACQSRCHVPGPPPTFRSIGKQLVDRFIDKWL
jgi:hypothetical protein